jgi:hypothetical protein
MPNETDRFEQLPASPIVVCPGCRKPMKPVALQSLTTPFEVTTYKCLTCEALTERITETRASSPVRAR